MSNILQLSIKLIFIKFIKMSAPEYNRQTTGLSTGHSAGHSAGQSVGQSAGHSTRVSHSPKSKSPTSLLPIHRYESLLAYIKYDCPTHRVNNSTYSTVYFTKDFVVKEQNEVNFHGFAATIKEILFLMELNHHNIIKIMALEPNPANDTFNIILPRYDIPLKQLLPQLDIYKRSNIIMKILGEIIRGVAYLHGHGIIHSDIKPENIYVRYKRKMDKLQMNIENIIFDDTYMEANSLGYLTYSYDMEVVIADFNISQLCINWNPKDVIVQTEFFRAPEVYLGRYDYRIDVWSIGCIILMMFNYGERYFQDRNTIKEQCHIYDIRYTGVWQNDYANLIKKIHMEESSVSHLQSYIPNRHPEMIISPDYRLGKNNADNHPGVSLRPDDYRLGKANNDNHTLTTYANIIKKINDERYAKFPDLQPSLATSNIRNLINLLSDCLCINKDVRKNAYTLLSEYFDEELPPPKNINLDIADDHIEMKMPDGETQLFDFEEHTRYMAIKLYYILMKKISDIVKVELEYDVRNILSYSDKILKRFSYYLASAFFDDNFEYQEQLLAKYRDAPKIIFRILKFIHKQGIKLI